MTPTFGAIFRAATAGQPLAAIHDQAETLRDALRETGAILVRGFAFGVADFEAFCALFGTQPLTHPGTKLGGRRRVSGSTATVDSGTLAFPWHAELAYAPHRPDLVAFTCETPPVEGGETLLTDGCAIAERLSAEADAVARRRVTYRYTRPEATWPVAFDGAHSRDEVQRVLEHHAARLDASEDLSWSFTRRRARVVRVEFTTPMLSTPRWSDRPAFCNHVIWQESRRRSRGRVRRLLRRRGGVALSDGALIPAHAFSEFVRAADALSYRVRWERGDVVLLDNSRVMHARGPVVDSDRRILARVCNVGAS